MLALLALSGLSAGCQVQVGLSTGWQDRPEAAGANRNAIAGGCVGRQLMFSSFWDGDVVVSQTCHLLPGGLVNTWRYVQSPRGEDDRRRDLTPAQASALLRGLSAMPPGQAPASPQDVLYFSFRTGEKGRVWETRIYDLKHLPPAVADLFASTGASATPPAGPAPDTRDTPDTPDYYPAGLGWEPLFPGRGG